MMVQTQCRLGKSHYGQEKSAKAAERREGVQEALLPMNLESILSASTMKEWWNLLWTSVGPELSQLHYDILSFCKAHELTRHQIQLRKDAMACIDRAVHEIWPIAETHLFGSTATGFALPCSDIDLVIMSPKNLGPAWRKPTPMSWQNELSRKLSGLGQCRSFKKIPFAKVPILKVVFNSGLACDISFDAHNSHASLSVIRHFAEQYESCRPLCLVLKFFLRRNNLNDLHIGGLSSFCLVTMVISHLQKTASIVEAGRGDLGTLLLSFFAYYSNIHSYTTDVVSTGPGFCGSKQDKGWVSQINPQLLSVEDPLDHTSDIGRGSYRIEHVRNKFSVAQKALLTHWHNEHVLGLIFDTTSSNELPAAPSPEKSKKSKRGGRKKRRSGSRRDEDFLAQQPAFKIPRRHYAQQGSGLVPKSQLDRIMHNIGGPTEENRPIHSGHSHLTQEGLDARVIRGNQDERTLVDFWESHLATRSKPRKISMRLSSAGVPDLLLRAQAEMSHKLPLRISKIQPSAQDEKLLHCRGAVGNIQQVQAERAHCGSQILPKVQDVKSVDEIVEIWEAQLTPRLKAGNCSSKQLYSGGEDEDAQPEQKSHLEQQLPPQCSHLLEICSDEGKLVDFWETHLNPKSQSKNGPWNDQQASGGGDEVPEMSLDERKLVDFWETHLNPKPKSKEGPFNDQQAAGGGYEVEHPEKYKDHGYDRILADFWEANLTSSNKSRKCASMHDRTARDEHIQPVKQHVRELATYRRRCTSGKK